MRASAHRRALRALPTATGEVSPKIAPRRRQIAPLPLEPAKPQQKTPKTVSAWAKQLLDFHPSPKQAEVLDCPARFIILCCNRQWGKTTTVAAKALHAALQTPKLNIVVIARSKEQAGLLTEVATQFAQTLGHHTRHVPGKQYSLLLPNLSRITVVPHTQDTSLGRTAHILIVDEAAAVTDAVYFSVSPFVGRTHGQIWLLSTPNRQAGFFYNFWHEKTNYWTRIFSNVADCPEIDPTFLEIQRGANLTRYRQDFLCEFIQPDNYLCNREFVRSMLRKKDRNQ